MRRPSKRLTDARITELCRRIAAGRTLCDVCRDDDMPWENSVYTAMGKRPELSEAIARAQKISAHGLAMSAVGIADEAVREVRENPRLERPKHWAQLIRNQCDQRRWLASKYNPTYADRMALTDADGGSLRERVMKMTDEQIAEEAARLAERARRLLGAPTIEGEAEDVGEE